MGYRSDIAIAVHKTAYLKYEMLLGKLPEILKNSNRNESETAYYWFFEGWKWYQGYEDVDEIMNFFGVLDDDDEFKHSMNLDALYGFLRVGEEDTDIEDLGDPYYYDIYVHRTLDTPFGLVESGTELMKVN